MFSPNHNRGWIAVVAPFAGILLLVSSGCGGLAGEPEIVATLPGASVAAASTSAATPVAGTVRGQVTNGSTGGLAPSNLTVTLYMVDATDNSTTLPAVADAGGAFVFANVPIDANLRYAVSVLYNDTLFWSAAMPGDPANPTLDLPVTIYERADLTATPASTTGTVRGQITNGSPGGSVPPDVAVTLYLVDATDNSATLPAVADAGGAFVFANVPIDANLRYDVSVLYNDTRFWSATVLGDPANPTLELPVTIYEPTNDPSGIIIRNVLMLVTPFTDYLDVYQIVSFENTLDRAYTGAAVAEGQARRTVQVQLPAGAIPHQMSEPWVYESSADGRTIFDNQAVVPGSRQVMHIAYALPYDDTPITVEFPVDYVTTGALQVLVPSDTVFEPNVDQMALVGMQPIDTEMYLVYETPLALAAGGVIRYDLRAVGLLQTADAAVSRNTLIAIVLIGSGGILLFVAGLTYWRGSHSQRSIAAETDSIVPDELVRQIAELDQAYQAGQIETADYQQQRRELKARLAERLKK